MGLGKGGSRMNGPLVIEVDDQQTDKVYRWVIDDLRFSAELAEDMAENEQDEQRARDYRIAADLIERHLYYTTVPR